jgi:mediator of DNA damage checkpoint protein 1
VPYIADAGLTAEKDYALDDPETEGKFKFKLADALRRAREAKQKLLEGHTFYLTGQVPVLIELITASAGGKVRSPRARSPAS